MGGLKMTKITIDKKQTVGKIKPMHAVGQPPFVGGSASIDFSPMQILTDANIPYSRLHDVWGAFGGGKFVDIPNIFRDFDADENDPASYDFTFTDALIRALYDYGVKPYYRLGVTIENQGFIKAYHIYPPKDYAKWARICEHIIRHYNEGWADGFYYGIEYWEIWNEPENREVLEFNQMWRGTKEEFFELYDVAAKHLKACFGDKIKIGGYAACGFYGVFGNPEKYGMDVERREGDRYNCPREDYRMQFLFDFFEYIKAHGSPIDFFSWHTYGTVDVVSVESVFLDKVLKQYGLEHIETHLNEWNLSHDRRINNANSLASSQVTAMMCEMQHRSTDMLMYYDARYVNPGAYGGFYDVATCAPSCVYYAFKAFGELYAKGSELKCEWENDKIFALAAGYKDDTILLITNTGEDDKIETDLTSDYTVYLIDHDNLYVETDKNPVRFNLAKNQTAIVKKG